MATKKQKPVKQEKKSDITIWSYTEQLPELLREYFNEMAEEHSKKIAQIKNKTTRDKKWHELGSSITITHSNKIKSLMGWKNSIPKDAKVKTVSISFDYNVGDVKKSAKKPKTKKK